MHSGEEGTIKLPHVGGHWSVVPVALRSRQGRTHPSSQRATEIAGVPSPERARASVRAGVPWHPAGQLVAEPRWAPGSRSPSQRP